MKTFIRRRSCTGQLIVYNTSNITVISVIATIALDALPIMVVVYK